MSNNKYKDLFEKVELDPSVKDRIENKMYSLKVEFEVGYDEKHIIEFVFDRFWGYVSIKIDDTTYKRKAMINGFRESRTYEFSVGEKEKHRVRIVLVRAALPIGYRECTVWVYVDEKLKGQYDGNLYLKTKKFREMNRQGRIAFISSILLIVALISFTVAYHLPIDIDEELNGGVFRAGTTEPEYFQPIRITVKGKYYRNMLIREPYRFEGSVHVYAREEGTGSGSQNHDSVSRINIGVPVIGGGLDAVRSFTFSSDGGFFYMKTDVSAFMIVVFELDANGDKRPAGGLDGIYYAAPCSTREEAVDIINELRPMVWRRVAAPIE
ncbi:MAG: hypothetical protein JXB33_03930 [Clostridia bacterium]|nr:hypothetical protein [Clostridia bacterium]